MRIAIIGGGAAGLMAAAAISETCPQAETFLIERNDGLGKKVIISGGGRCNVTHDVVDERAYAVSTPAAIRNVLRRFTVEQTVAFFADLGVRLKREETGKLFPVSDDARSVLEALLSSMP